MEWQEPTECSLCGSSNIAPFWFRPEAFVCDRGIEVEWEEFWHCDDCANDFADRKRQFEFDDQMVNQTQEGGK